MTTDLDLARHAILNVRLQALASDPSSPVAGMAYFNTASGKIRYYTGSAWIQLDSPTSHTHSASDITSGTLALARGGTAADLSATGGSNQIVKQTSAGGALSVAALSSSDIPSLDTSKLTTGTLAVARGGNGVAALPAFFVHKNGASQTGIVANTLTKVTWSTETYDTNSNFASDKFTPTIAGKYLLLCAILWDNTTADQVELLTALYKNGSILLDSRINTSGASKYQLVMLSTIVDANGSTDNFEIYAKHGDSANRTVYGGAANTWWTGTWVAP